MMKVISLTISSFFISLFSFAQGTWTELNALIAPQRASEIPHSRLEPTGFAVNGQAYICTGYDFDNYFNDLFGFNPSTNTWLPAASLPASGRRMAQGGEINGKGFITLGTDGVIGFTDSWEFDPLLMSWSSKASFLGNPRKEGFSFSLNNKFYTGGGVSIDQTEIFSDFWEYDPILNTWTAKASLPVPLAGSKSFHIGNLGYVVGGYDSTFNMSSSCYTYDPQNDIWSTVASFPGTIVSVAMADSMLGFVVDGTTLYSFNPDSNSWSIKSPLPHTTLEPVSCNVNGLLYLLSYDRSVLSYNPITDSWIENYNSLESGRPQIEGNSIVISDTAFFKLMKYDIANDHWKVDSVLDLYQWFFSINSVGFATRPTGFEKFDPATHNWTSCNSGPIFFSLYSFSNSSRGYVLGLTINSTVEFWEYNPQSDVWTRKADFPGRNQGNGGSFSINNNGYIVAGIDSMGFAIDDFWEYNTILDTWSQRPSIPGGPRMNFFSTSWNNRGVAAFGIDGSTGVTVCGVTSYSEIDSSWTGLNYPFECRSGNVIGFGYGNKFFIGQGERRFTMGIRDPYFDFWSYDEITLNVPSSKIDSDYHIYPNPSHGNYTLYNSRNVFEKTKVTIVDVLNRVIFQKEFEPGTNEYIFNLEATAGIYIMNIENDINSKMVTRKIILE